MTASSRFCTDITIFDIFEAHDSITHHHLMNNLKGSGYVPEVVYTLLPIDYVHDSQSVTDSRLYTYSIVSFLSLIHI